MLGRGGAYHHPKNHVKESTPATAILILRLMMSHIPFVVSPSGDFSGPEGFTTNGSYRCKKQKENCCPFKRLTISDHMRFGAWLAVRSSRVPDDFLFGRYFCSFNELVSSFAVA
ncbi:MAG: hypothetical protein K9N21_09720 [Deltaproteobacteria bacterium]|nr:hypothetical protein [Deltaproteobacteria bacterium]